LANLQPSGKFFMEDLYYAGGLPAVIKEMKNVLHNDALTVNGKGIGANSEGAEVFDRNIVGTMEVPFKENSGIAVVRGNLALNGAVIKPSAATPALMTHRGKAVVFETIEDYHARIEDPDLDIDENSIMVLKNVGPKGYPGMAEVGNMGIPKKLLEKGVHDLVRISDGRMSGTGFGTVVLHVSPEAADGGNLALVQNGDYISLDVPNRSLNLEVSEKELTERRKNWQPIDMNITRGYVSMYIKHVEQAHLGADMDFLKGKSGSVVSRDSH
jgi:L-arabonate dehydrase